jgi:aromatic ring-opening dioxygenase LigB subunit
MAQAGKEIAATDPDIVVLVSPHSPRKRDTFGVCRPPMLRGVLDQFGWHQPFFEFSNNLNLANDIQQRGADTSLRFFDIPANSLDHGATVPSYFPSQAEWIGDIVVTGLGPHEGGMLEKLDTSIRSACDDQGLSFALIAGGDMPHRATASAPCEFHPDAPAWDQYLIRMVQWTDSEAIEPAMRRIDHPSQSRTQRIDVTGHSPIRQGGETD